MPKVYYKVVKQIGERYFSYMHGSLNGLEVEYKIDEYVEANIKGADLMIFDNYWNAWNFLDREMRYGNSFQIFKCYAQNVSKRGLLTYLTCFDLRKLVEDFIRDCKIAKSKHKPKPSVLDKEIEGTLFAKKVKLLEKAIP